MINNPAQVDTAFFYKSDGVPWTGLGVPIDETVEATEAHIAAQTDWLVEKWPIYAHSPDGSRQLPMENNYATTRVNKDGTAAPLGHVTGGYSIVQQADACAFAAALSKEGGLRMHTGGSLRGGRIIWFMGRYPKQFEIVPDDIIDCNLFICNSHDGTMYLSVGATTVRIVCMNTLMGGVADAKRRGRFMSVRHTGDPLRKLYEAQRILGLSEVAFEKQELLLRELVDIPMTEQRVEEALDSLFPDPDEGTSPARANSLRSQVLEIYNTSPTLDMPGVRGTGYGFLNAVTQYADHSRGKSLSQEKRLFSAWFERGADIKEEAVSAVVKVTGARISNYSSSAG